MRTCSISGSCGGGLMRPASVRQSTATTSGPSALRRPALPHHQRRHGVRPLAASPQPGETEVPDVTYDFVAQNLGLFRALPLYAGGAGIVGVLANRLFSGEAPIIDATSDASRVDVIVIFLSAVLVLTGLQWLSLKPREMLPEDLRGRDVGVWTDPDVKLPPGAADELLWAWQSLTACTRVRSLVLIYNGRNVFHAGSIAQSVRPGSATAGEICSETMASGRGNYLANLTLYPGRPEFMGYLPEGTQGVVVQPVGKAGVLVAGTDVIRGVSRLDQAWIAAIADKLEVSLEKFAGTKGAGFGVAGKK